MAIFDGPNVTQFFLEGCFKDIQAKYWICWIMFIKYFIPGSDLMGLMSYDFSSKVCFKYLGAKYLRSRSLLFNI